jgi:hypothetical protein
MWLYKRYLLNGLLLRLGQLFIFCLLCLLCLLARVLLSLVLIEHRVFILILYQMFNFIRLTVENVINNVHSLRSLANRLLLIFHLIVRQACFCFEALPAFIFQILLRAQSWLLKIPDHKVRVLPRVVFPFR